MKKILVSVLVGMFLGSIELPSFSAVLTFVGNAITAARAELPYILPSQSPLIWALTLITVIFVTGVYAFVMSFTTEFIDALLHDFQLRGKELAAITAGAFWPIAWPVIGVLAFIFACISLGEELAEQQA